MRKHESKYFALTVKRSKHFFSSESCHVAYQINRNVGQLLMVHDHARRTLTDPNSSI